MSKLKTLEDLFYHELRDLYSAESQLIDALPKMVKEVSNSDLRNALENHLEETKQHKQRLEEISKQLDIKIEGETCHAMKGLIREAKSFISEDADPEVMDAGIIADAQRVEHYEIAAYGTAIEFAKQIGKNDIADKLYKTLEDERSADTKLTALAKRQVNLEADI